MDNQHKCIIIQKAIKKFLYKSLKKYNNCKCENIEDPFTYDNIDEISENLKFGFKDKNGYIYIFNAIEFEYFIRINGNWNPYTKEILPEYVKNRLELFIRYNGLIKKSDNEFKWNSSLQAYTEVSQIMEKNGFYNNILWFNKLTYEKCKNIIKTYRKLSKNNNYNNIYFCRGFEFSKKTYIYDFCREIIRLFKEGDEHYILCCIFMKSISLYINEFYMNLPEWLLDIDTPLNYPEFNDTLFMLFIQNLIDTNRYVEYET